MFGEQLIIGKSEGKIDEKGRIFIPSFVNPEPDDKIIIQEIIFDDEFALKLTAVTEYLGIIERLKNLRNNATTVEEYNKFNAEIENICLQLNYLVQIDKQKRILIPKNAINSSGWLPKDELQFNGLGNSLLVRKKPQNK